MGETVNADVVIVGAGITGALVAERLTRNGLSVALIDRHAPATGSTLASTAMLQWESDASLLELEDRFGFEAAARLCRQNVEGLMLIGRLAAELGIDCGFTPKGSIYLAGDKLDAVSLKEEQKLRRRVGVQSRFLEADELAARGVKGTGGLFSPHAAAADPVALAEGVLQAAVVRGALVISPALATDYERERDWVCVRTREGAAVRGRWLVLASGYEMPEFVKAPGHSIVSSWAVAIEPLSGEIGDMDALLWEASDPYLYARAGPGGRVIAGGEDVDTDDAASRDAMTQQKASAIMRKLGERMPALAGLEAELAWGGFFGETEDSLPLIGPAPGYPRCLAAFGYGGNGITYSAFAAEMLAGEIAGHRHPNAQFYALDRAG